MIMQIIQMKLTLQHGDYFNTSFVNREKDILKYILTCILYLIANIP